LCHNDAEIERRKTGRIRSVAATLMHCPSATQSETLSPLTYTLLFALFYSYLLKEIGCGAHGRRLHEGDRPTAKTVGGEATPLFSIPSASVVQTDRLLYTALPQVPQLCLRGGGRKGKAEKQRKSPPYSFLKVGAYDGTDATVTTLPIEVSFQEGNR